MRWRTRWLPLLLLPPLVLGCATLRTALEIFCGAHDVLEKFCEPDQDEDE